MDFRWYPSVQCPIAAVANELGLKDTDRVILENELGELLCQVYIAPIQSGNLQVHWPEGNVLLDKSK